MDPPPLPTHSFFNKPKTQSRSSQQPAASTSSSSSLPAPPPPPSASASSSTSAAPPPPITTKKRKPKAPSTDSKQGKLSFASGSGLGVVAAAAVEEEEEEEVAKKVSKKKGKAKAKDEEKEERKEMEAKKKALPAPVKKSKKLGKKEGGGGGEEGANEVDVNDQDPLALLPPAPASFSSKATSSSTSSTTLPPPPIASTSTLPTNTTITKKRVIKPNFLLKQPPKASSSKLASKPPAAPSSLQLQPPPSPSKSQTESVDLTQDDSDEDPSSSRHPSPSTTVTTSSVPAKGSRLRTTSTTNPKPRAQKHPVSIVSSDEDDDEVQEIVSRPSRTRKQKGRIQEIEEIDSDGVVEGRGPMELDEEDGREVASSSKGTGKAKDLSFFEPRMAKTKKKGSSAQAPIDLEEQEDVVVVKQQPAARRKKSLPRSSRSPSIIDLDLDSPVKPKSKKPLLAVALPPAKEVHSFFAKRKAVVREGGVGGAGGTGGGAMKQQEPVEARWPTAEETHVGFSFGGERPSSSSWPKKSIIVGKGKGRQMDLDEEDASPSFFANNFSITKPSTAQRLFALLSSNVPTLSPSLPSASQPQTQPSLPPHLLSNPAFARLLSSSNASSQPHPPLPPSKHHHSELWVEKYKPRSAPEVLHNSTEAIYLREWLIALQVQGKAKDEKDEHEHALAKSKGKGKGKAAVVPAKRKIVRAVVKEDPKLKKRKKGDKSGYGEEDWIVNSDEEEEEEEDPIFSDFEEFEDEEEETKDSARSTNLEPDASTSSSCSLPLPPSLQKPNLRHPASATSSYPSLSTLLTNSILLLGPPGSGKTSSVYACAAELGWEVFEVYPGVGKRSGLALASLVGDMSKNHIVGKGGMGGGRGGSGSGFFGGGGDGGKEKATNAFALMMKGKGGGGGGGSGSGVSSTSSRKGGAGAGGGGGSAHDAISLDDDDDANDSKPSPGPFPSTSDTVFASPRGSTGDPSPVKGEVVGSQPSKVRQSLILLEEVDVLFNEEDKGFWQGLIALISESRRPVVMTCNDLSTLPLFDLPLQTILEYQPPPPSLAVPYLHLLAQAQGFSPALETVTKLYTQTAVHRTPGAGLEDGVGHPAPSQEREGSDLRRAIGALQIGCCGERREGDGKQSVGVGAVGDVLEGLAREGGHWEVGLADWATGGRKRRKTNENGNGARMEVNQHQQPSSSSSSVTNNSSAPPPRTLESISTLLDNISFINSHIDIRTSSLLELEEIDRYSPSPDDEVGYDLLRKWKGDPVDGPPVLAGTGWEREMAIEAGVLARELFDEEGEEGGFGSGKEIERVWSLREMQEKRSHHLASLLNYLSPLIEPPTPLLPHPSLLLSHAPFIRHLVAQDDVFILEESQGLRAAEEGGRSIRPSARAAMIALAIGRTGGELVAGAGGGAGSSRLYGYQRWVVGLREEELREVRGSGLGLGW